MAGPKLTFSLSPISRTLRVLDVSEVLSDLTSNNHKKRRQALEVIYQEYFPHVSRLVIAQGGTEEDAMDVFQEGVIDFYTNIKTGAFKNISSSKTYLIAICKNKWYQRFKKEKRLVEVAKLQTPISEEYEEIDTKLLASLIDELNPDCRRVLRSFYYQKDSMAQIKDDFNLSSIQAAKNKKFRCLKYLMRLIKEKGLSQNNFLLKL